MLQYKEIRDRQRERERERESSLVIDFITLVLQYKEIRERERERERERGGWGSTIGSNS